ncbi:MAG: hypothetical protein AAF721_27290 [Myxococcota bacterium]
MSKHGQSQGLVARIRARRGGRGHLGGKLWAGVVALPLALLSWASTGSDGCEPPPAASVPAHTTDAIASSDGGPAPRVGVALLDRPPRPRAVGEYASLQRQIEFFADHHNVVAVADVEARTEALHRRAVRFGDARLIARALIVQSVVRAGIDEADAEPSRALAEQAFEVAVAAAAADVAALAAATAASHALPDALAFQHWMDRAESQLELAGVAPAAEAEIALAWSLAVMNEVTKDNALVHLVQRITLNEERLGADHPRVGADYELLAREYVALDNDPLAEDAARRAIQILEAALPSGDPLLVMAHVDLGSALFGQGKHAAAGRAFDLAVPWLAGGPDLTPQQRDNHERAYWILARFATTLGDFEGARGYYRAIVGLDEPDGAWCTMLAHTRIGKSYLAEGRPQEAIGALREALSYTDPEAAEWPARIEARQLLAELEAG